MFLKNLKIIILIKNQQQQKKQNKKKEKKKKEKQNKKNEEEEEEDLTPKGTEISWKKDKCLNLNTIIKKKKNKQGKVKNFTKTEPCESFYNFFLEYDAPFYEGMEHDEKESVIKADTQICELLRDEVIPNSVNFYTGSMEGLSSLEDLFGNMGLEGGEEGDEEDDEEGGVKFDDPNVQKLNKQSKDPECKNQ